MKIFISWSGKRSLGVATALRDWLPYLFSSITLFVSSEDIRKGKRWPLEVSKELDASNFGIVCLTPDNTEAPWLLFESGALSKSLKDASVYTLLTGGLKPSDIEGPLSHFQHTAFEKDDFLKLVKAINEAQTEAKQDEARLKKVFEKWWDELEANIEKILSATDKPEKKRSLEDMLKEVLETTGYIARNIPKQPLHSVINAETTTLLGAKRWSTIVKQSILLLPDIGDVLVKASFATFDDGVLTITFPTTSENELKNSAAELAPVIEKAFDITQPDFINLVRLRISNDLPLSSWKRLP